VSGIVIVPCPHRIVTEPLRTFRGIIDSPCYYPDGSLRVILEARLATRKLWEMFQPFSRSLSCVGALFRVTFRSFPLYTIAVCDDIVCIFFLPAQYLRPRLRIPVLGARHGRPDECFRGLAVSKLERGDRCAHASGTEFILRLGWCEAGKRRCHLFAKRYFDLLGRIDPRVLCPFSLLLNLRAKPQAVSACSRRDRQ
jgi:hypothetical protein